MLYSFGRTVFLYLVLLAIVRLMGKRQLGQMEPAEFAVALLLAELAAMPMEDQSISLAEGLVPMGAVLLMERLLSGLCLHSVRLRRLLCGRPVVLIENGQVLQASLRATRITMEELTECLRQENILCPGSVQYAILETGGNLSVIPYPEEAPASAREAGIPVSPRKLPVTLVSDGKLCRENLKAAGKDAAWVERYLKSQGLSVSGTFLLTADGTGSLFCLAKEKNRPDRLSEAE